MIVHATNNAVARRTSILAAVLLLLMPALVKAAVGVAGLFAAPYALFTLHACCRPSGGRLSRFFFPAIKSDKLQERLKALDR